MMKFPILAILAITASEARVYQQQGSLNSTNISSSITSTPSHTITNSPASIPSAGLASITRSTNTTSSAAPTTTSAAETCCYLYPQMVGINTWWTSSVDVTVATVTQNWLKYNNTIILGNSTTRTLINSTDIYGTRQANSYDYATTATITANDSTILSTFDVFSGVPRTLLPANAVLYGESIIASGTIATFPSQSLAISAPTPYYRFGAINVYTSTVCMVTTTTTDYTTYIPTTINGYATQISSVLPTATVTAFNSVPAGIAQGGSGDVYINQTVAKPFPDGDYSDFNFTDWANGVTIGPSPGSVDAYMFNLPEDFPSFLADIPFVKSAYSDIGSCTNFAGNGEPTVHIPVNQLTDTADVTMTMSGALATSREPVTQAPEIAISTTNQLETPLVTGGGTYFSVRTEITQTGLQTGGGEDKQSKVNTAHTQTELETPSPTAKPSPKAPQIARPDTSLDIPTSASTQNIGGIIASVIGMVPETTAPSFSYIPAPLPEITIGRSIVTGDSNTEFIIGTQTLVQGGSAITDGGNTVQIIPQGTGPAVVVNGNTSPLAAQPASTPGITIGNSVITADSSSHFVVGSQTLVPGGAAITFEGSTLLLGQEATAVVVNGISTPIAQAQADVPAPELTIGNQVITANAASEFVISSQTLTPGGMAVTIAGTTLSLASGASAIVINGQTSNIAVPVGAPVTLGGELATPIASGAYVLPEGETLRPGASGVILAGTTYSLAEGGSSLIVNGVTAPVPSPDGPTKGSVTELILPGTTILPGSEAVVSGTTYSLPRSGAGIYINGKSTSLPSAQPGSPITLPNLVVATPTIVPDVVFGSQTLLPGGVAVTVSGTTYSASGTAVIIIASGRTTTQVLSDFESSITATGSRSSLPTSSQTTRGPDSSTAVAQSSSAPAATSTSGSADLSIRGQLSTVALVVALAVCLI